MKRSEMFEKIEVICPTCEKTRQLNKSSYKGDLSKQPYIQTCGGCARSGRTMSPEAVGKIREAMTGRKLSDETKDKIRLYRKSHPELWVTLQPELGPKARKGTKHSEESKKKISEGVRRTKGVTNEP